MADTMGTVITIDNFKTQMSDFKLSTTSGFLYGLVDMGSNGIRFSISDLSPPRSRLLHCIHRERAGISLYDALHEEKPDSKPFYFSQDTVLRVAQTLRRFKGICDSYGVQKENISVFATEAMRTSKNRDEMFGAIKKESGLTIDILSPGMESLFGAMGARSGYTDVDGLFMDLGGGSVQMTYVNSYKNTEGQQNGYDVAAAKAATSMPFGAAKLTQALNGKETAEAAKTELRSLMKETFEGMKEKFPDLKRQAESSKGVTIYFCGGGFRGYGSMLMHTDPIQPYPIPAIGGYTVEGHRFIKWREMLHANNYEEGKIFGMSKRRREQFPAIVHVVQSLVEAVPKINKVIFCSGGNREGILYMKLPLNIREQNPLSLLPVGSEPPDAQVVGLLVECIKKALPEGYPSEFSDEILNYTIANAWRNLGNPDDANSAKALHDPISGHLAGLPGMTHKIRAILALIMCARWGADLSPLHKKMYESLREIVQSDLSWWCEYIGTVARLIAMVVPSFPKSGESIVSFESEMRGDLGKKGKKFGIKLNIQLRHGQQMLSDVDLEGLFGKIGKGLHTGWKVEAEIVS